MKRLLLIILSLISISLSGEELSKNDWTILFGQLEGGSLSFSNKLLTTSIPTYLFENMPEDAEHSMTENERDIIEISLRKEKLEEFQKEKRELWDKRDELLFTGGTEEKRAEYTEDISALNTKIEEIDNWILADGNDITIKLKPDSAEDLEELDEFRIDYYLKQESIDYYIGGNIDEEYENLFVNLYIYSKYSDERVNFWSGIGSSEEILNYREDMLLALFNVILSDQVIPFSITANESDSLIYIDDTFVGLGAYKGISVRDKSLEIKVEKEGFVSYSDTIKVNESGKSITVDLEKISQTYILVDSEPQGAKLYYASRYIGTTPLELPLQSNAQKLTISLDGYIDTSYIIDDRSRDFTAKLIKGVPDSEARLKSEKGFFYTATAAFTISLGIPLFLGTQDSENGTLLHNISIGNAVVMGLNLFYRLYRYLQAAEASVE